MCYKKKNVNKENDKIFLTFTTNEMVQFILS